ncbi:uncharacterized protein BJ171DRAFT_596312 [Polychytrium aggregatum]|uniref:uncharacterized protein n=1 Tax=Polychytrium aggregatum TaxID=110093 RepID=UPI0022FF0BE1|nr:uncharacterized protein BJ171DRAFT_596312 [Polychytrium aggregatum]KAI9207888.1 hypothetical protein BJ171DRAFT_596312 [Polychytrium aggregatum]
MDHSSSDASINSASSNATDDPAELERLIFSAINDGDRDGLIEILENPSSSTAILQLMLTTSYPNADHFYKHDPEVQQDADELLGQSVENLNAIQIACILGDEEIASDILEFVVRITEEIEARKVLYEFMGRVWGNGNTVLHLASFLGMCELVARLLELGANPNKKNERQYKPVDCTNDNETLLAFNNVTEAPRPPAGSSNHEDFRPRASSVQSVDELLAAPNRSLQQGVISISRPLQNLKRSSSEKLCASSEDYPDEKSPSLTNLCRSGSANSRGLNDTTATPIASTASGTVGAIRRSVGTIRKSRSHTKLTDSADSKPQHQQQEHKASKKVHFNPKTFLFQICQNGESDKSIDPDIPSLAEILHQLETTDRASSESSPSDDTVEQSQQSQQPIINTIFTPYQWLSPLHQACSHGHSSVVKQLLQSKALVNARDKEGWTPLHCACAEGHVEVVRILGQCRGPHSIGLALSASGTDAFGAIYCCPDGPIDLEAVNDDGDTPEGLARDIEDVTRRKEVLDVLKDIKERHAAMSLKDPPDQLGDDQLVPDGDDDDDTWSISDYYVNITLRSLPKPDTQPVRSAMKGSRDSLASDQLNLSDQCRLKDANNCNFDGRRGISARSFL